MTDPYTSPDPYARRWKNLTATPRPSFEMDGIGWGAFPGDDAEENPTCDAAELAEQAGMIAAHEMMMDVLLRDLRCIDAHAHLDNWAFDRSPTRALAHYEVGVRIGRAWEASV